jgi:hypothetical protein
MSETEFARAERMSRELYFANEKLKVYDRMASSGVWVESEKYSILMVRLQEATALLERAKESFTDVAFRIAKREPQDLVGHVVWLADLERFTNGLE